MLLRVPSERTALLHPIVEAPHGAHEVIVDDRKHDVVLSSESLQMYRDRFAYYEAQPWVNAVALDETPPRLRRLSANAWAHHRGARVCYWCALAHTENVYANGRFVVVRSPVPRFAGEIFVIPKFPQTMRRHSSTHFPPCNRVSVTTITRCFIRRCAPV